MPRPSSIDADAILGVVSQENIETLRRFFDAAARDDLAAALECLDPELEFLPRRASTEGPYRGHAGFERFRADTWEHYDSFEPRYELEDLGSCVLAWGAVYVRGKGSGLETEVPSAGIFDFRGGRILRWRDFGSRDKALEVAAREAAEASP